MLWLIAGSYSFRTTDATESITTSLALQVMMCSSSFWTLQSISWYQSIFHFHVFTKLHLTKTTETANIASYWHLLTSTWSTAVMIATVVSVVYLLFVRPPIYYCYAYIISFNFYDLSRKTVMSFQMLLYYHTLLLPSLSY